MYNFAVEYAKNFMIKNILNYGYFKPITNIPSYSKEEAKQVQSSCRRQLDLLEPILNSSSPTTHTLTKESGLLKKINLIAEAEMCSLDIERDCPLLLSLKKSYSIYYKTYMLELQAEQILRSTPSTECSSLCSSNSNSYTNLTALQDPRPTSTY